MSMTGGAGLLSEDDARQLTNEIRRVTADLWDKILLAWEGKAWAALGYTSWKTYCAMEFDSVHLSLPKAERAQVVQRLTDAGMSSRDTAAAVNVDQKTVINDHRETSEESEENSSAEPEPEPEPAPEPEPDPEPEPGPDPLIERFITQTAQSINRFAGTSSHEECVALRNALKKPLARLDARIAATEKGRKQ